MLHVTFHSCLFKNDRIVTRSILSALRRSCQKLGQNSQNEEYSTQYLKQQLHNAIQKFSEIPDFLTEERSS